MKQTNLSDLTYGSVVKLVDLEFSSVVHHIARAAEMEFSLLHPADY